MAAQNENNAMELKILELFSGIGGMHMAFQYSQIPGTVVAAMDINTVANDVYKHNHTTKLLNNNIQKLSLRTLENLDIDTVLMSPPCQPHTRVGKQRDVEDDRSDALSHLTKLLPQHKKLRYVIMENVKGFENSQARQNFIEAMALAGFYWREFILSPTQFGVPNARHRYYYIARRNADFAFSGSCLLEQMPDAPIRANMEFTDYLELEEDVPSEAYLSDNILNKYVFLLDIVNPASTTTMCFTKAYTHYIEGTGSVFTTHSEDVIEHIFTLIRTEDQQEKKSQLLRDLHLRFFTPKEVARLMSFPDSFEFPKNTTTRQKYRLLGNSINVRVVGELMKLLLK